MQFDPEYIEKMDHIGTKKWKWLIAVIILLAKFFVVGQKLYSQQSDAKFPPSPDKQVNKFFLNKITFDKVAENETKWMKKKLKLTKDQLQRVKAINTVYAFRLESYLTVRSMKVEENKQKNADAIAYLDKEKDDMLRKVFTEKQYHFYLKEKPELVKKIDRLRRKSESHLINTKEIILAEYFLKLHKQPLKRGRF